MKVLFFIHGLPIGGAETVTVNNLIQLKERGVDVALATYDDRPSFLRDRVKESGIPFRSILPYCGNDLFGKCKRFVLNKTVRGEKRWREILALEKPDVVHYNDYGELPLRFPFPPEKSVLTIHSDVLRAASLCTPDELERTRALSRAGLTWFALNGKAESDLRSAFGAERVVTVPNGVDLSYIRENAYGKAWLSERYGVPEDAFVLGHVGRFHPIKNHERVVSIFEKTLAIEPRAYLVLVGGDVDGRMERIAALAKERGLADRVVFTGVRNDANLVAGCFDAFLLPSFSEAFPLSLIEAQAAGVRCVAADTIPEEVFCTPLAHRLSLKEPDEVWARTVVSKERSEREDAIGAYDVGSVVGRMIAQYEKLV